MIRRGWIACMLSALVFAATLRAQNQALDAGVQLMREGKFDQALEKLEQPHRAEPRNAVIENLLGITATKLGRSEDADNYYRDAIRLDPSQAAPHRNLGFNLLTEKKYTEAEPELREATRLDRNDAFAHYYLMLLALATNRDAEALDEASRAGNLIDTDADVAAKLAEARIRTKKADDAMAGIERLENTNQLSIAREYQVAVLFAQYGFYSQSAHCFRRIAAVEPTWQNRYNFALALLYANQPEQASALLNALHKDQPANADILMYLGASYEMLQEMPQALDAYRAALAADPFNPDRMLDYTRLLMDTDRYDEAIQAIQSGIAETDASAPLQLRLGAVEMAKGDYSAARQSFRAALAADPNLDAADVGLAETYSREANDTEAIRILGEARQKKPGRYLLEFYFGLLASRLGRDDEAITALNAAARLQPQSPGPFFELGELYETQQNWDQARGDLERVVALSPKSAPAHYQLSRVYARLGMKAKAEQEAQQTRVLIDEQRDEVLRRQRERGASFQPQVSSIPSN
jgi:tetratricopeptide (TPR) repeat protein